MNKTLYYVDDEDNQVAALETWLAVANSGYTLKPYTQGDRVAQFMEEVATAGSDDRFLLDVFMPPPRPLRLQDVWPAQHAGEAQYCGIALAVWLVNKKGIAASRIALYTHVDRQAEHEATLKQLLPEVQPERFGKSDLEGIRTWLGF